MAKKIKKQFCVKAIVEELLSNSVEQGMSSYDLGMIIRKQNWTAAEKDEITQGVLESIVSSARSNPELVKGWSLLNMQFLYKKLVESGDYPNALRAAKEIFALANQLVNENVQCQNEENTEPTKQNTAKHK